MLIIEAVQMTNNWPNMAHHVSEVTADDRLFPRVMDWNIEHQDGPLTHQQCSQINAPVAAQACSENKTFQDEICHFPALFSSVPSLNQKKSEHVSDTQVLKSLNFLRNEQTSWMRAHSRGPREQLLSSAQPEPPSSEGFYRSPVVLSSINWQKRVERSPMLTPATSITSKASISARKDEIAPSLARSLLTGYGAKQCSFDKCMKIAGDAEDMVGGDDVSNLVVPNVHKVAVDFVGHMVEENAVKLQTVVVVAKQSAFV
ncbi:hypothetical protein PsorP6_006850 [Peronosclerospora sorghi]|uniref:Uncharacterized protein n=1 Tax=Peronosclerospora sorghi TaxID=230839 RepID=A0ACC0WBC0_9STRA|nr:hypothetical protein PsorP6_006850 [Peronosclerospora sorghi]